MERDKIIKALECCTGDTADCNNCPYWAGFDENCFDNAKRDALALIKELTEENERLTTNLVEQSAENVMLIGENKRLQKALNTDISIVRVSRGSGKTAHLREVGRIKVDAIRADTVRKMHSMLCEGRVSNDNVVIVANQIAKEMLEGNNDND